MIPFVTSSVKVVYLCDTCAVFPSDVALTAVSQATCVLISCSEGLTCGENNVSAFTWGNVLQNKTKQTKKQALKLKFSFKPGAFLHRKYAWMQLLSVAAGQQN